MTLLNPKQAADYLRTKGVIRSPVTLRNLRLKGRGPQFQKMGNSVYYQPELLDEWINERLTAPVRSTSELASHAA